MRAAVSLGLLALTLAGCQSAPRAPNQAGVCWIDKGGGRMAVLDSGLENLETCGARLEAVRLIEGRPVRGAFGGVFVFADDTLIGASPRIDGPHIWLFSPQDRLRIDAAIRQVQRAKTPDV